MRCSWYVTSSMSTSFAGSGSPRPTATSSSAGPNTGVAPASTAASAGGTAKSTEPFHWDRMPYLKCGTMYICCNMAFM